MVNFKFLLVFIVTGAIMAGKVRAQGGTVLDSTEARALVNSCAARFPKFYGEFKDIQKRDTLIKKIVFLRNQDLNGGPAKAGMRGNILIDVKYLETEQANFDDNRLIVVLYHEIGHLHYFMSVPPPQRDIMQNEKYAFEYSLMKTKEMADNGDCQPLKTGLKYMKLRSQSPNLQDPHVQALRLMVNEPLYAGYLKYVREKCR
jgi:hypothetical protein